MGGIFPLGVLPGVIIDEQTGFKETEQWEEALRFATLQSGSWSGFSLNSTFKSDVVKSPLF